MLGLYVSIPFCRAKCTFCNFASDAFGAALLPGYLRALQLEISAARDRANAMGVDLPHVVDTIYLGGGTPSLLDPDQIKSLFARLREHFSIAPGAEITVECAPGQLSDVSLAQFVWEGVNRLSFGVQSFVAEELRAAGRSHTGRDCFDDLARARAAGVKRLSVDLIAGLPRQTADSWKQSLGAVLASGVGHVSLYMLEVDSGSRLGREVLGNGTRYGAPHVPGDDECVTLYEQGCEVFTSNGLMQYEISNFAREGELSSHNLKYWTREPYLGFGLDAHSMLLTGAGTAVRFHNGDDLASYVADREVAGPQAMKVISRSGHLSESASRERRLSRRETLEETIFLGLRLNAGLDLEALHREFGDDAALALEPALGEAQEGGLLWLEQRRGRRHAGLTLRGRSIANEVLVRLLEGLDTSEVDAPFPEEAVA